MVDQANFYADEIEKMEAELEQLRESERNILTMSKSNVSPPRNGRQITVDSNVYGSIGSPSRSIGSGLFKNKDEYNYHSKGI